MTLHQKLHSWRAEQARKEGVELYRVFSNSTLDLVAREKPADKAALLAIKGIAEKKYEKYGSEILGMVKQCHSREGGNPGVEETLQNSGSPIKSGMTREEDSGIESEKVKTVGEYLDFTNTVLQEMPARVKGEVSSIDIRGSYLFYTIKDLDGQASLSVFMWRNRYDICGVALEEGMEVIIEGHAEIYKPSGRFSFRADSVELVGEGALKAAYEKLKSKLEQEGLFSPERKRVIPHFPQKIGLITSRDGAVIHDFLNNIGKFGYKMRFVNSRVEGQMAVTDLLRAVRILSKEKLDVLIVIRGGGSLESLQAFNNETLVRELASFPVPVICGIGHDKDMPLASMTADMAVSTPTAVTKVLNSTWEQLLSKIDIFERDIFGSFERSLYEVKTQVQENSQLLSRVFATLVERCRNAEEKLRRCVVSLEHRLEFARGQLAEYGHSLGENMQAAIESTRERVQNAGRHIATHDPRRQLKLGYSIARSRGKVIRSVKDVKAGDEMDILLSDGDVGTEVKKINKTKK